MTNDAKSRIQQIEDLQTQMAGNVKKAETGLFELLLQYWSALRDNPAMLRKLWKRFAGEAYNPLFKNFALDIKTILALNEEYFIKTNSVDRIKEIASIANGRINDRLGIEASGKVIQGGYMDTLVQDQTAKREVQRFFYRTRAIKNEKQLHVDLKNLVKGVEEKGGVVSKLFNNYAFDTYQEADRLAQNEYADKLQLDAAIYTGGVIESSRPFCVERNRKIFTREEIALFGTPADKFEGYSDKSTGKFAGKPKDGYDPFTQCGGIACRHHLSWVSKEYAVRLDETLIVVEGKLVRKEE